MICVSKRIKIWPVEAVNPPKNTIIPLRGWRHRRIMISTIIAGKIHKA